MGTCAGVLQPPFDSTDPFSTNSLGVFTVGVPTDGAFSGSFLMFTRGRVFGGTMQGVADPNKAVLKGVLYATYRYNLTTFDSSGVPSTNEVTATVTGPIDARITSNGNGFATSSALLIGPRAHLSRTGEVNNDLDPIIDGTVSLEVMGFKQSNAAPASGTLTPPSPKNFPCAPVAGAPSLCSSC